MWIIGELSEPSLRSWTELRIAAHGRIWLFMYLYTSAIRSYTGEFTEDFMDMVMVVLDMLDLSMMMKMTAVSKTKEKHWIHTRPAWLITVRERLLELVFFFLPVFLIHHHLWHWMWYKFLMVWTIFNAMVNTVCCVFTANISLWIASRWLDSLAYRKLKWYLIKVKLCLWYTAYQ